LFAVTDRNSVMALRRDSRAFSPHEVTSGN
jgi:hypothetical protein